VTGSLGRVGELCDSLAVGSQGSNLCHLMAQLGIAISRLQIRPSAARSSVLDPVSNIEPFFHLNSGLVSRTLA
jgi:hypothetical protein